MDNNETDIVKVERKVYTKEVLNSLRSSERSNLWPKSLDKSCINSHGQWDPVKSFDSSKPNDTKRNSFYENKIYRNNDKNKDDISLRPERRKWNDGCQVTNNKRNNEDSHSNSYRKSYQSTTPNNGGGDCDRRSFNRNNSRTIKPNDKETNKYNNIKLEKNSRNNSNLDERHDDKEEHKYNTKNSNNEPEWFSNGPENCDETIELHGITANDSAIAHFKKDSTKNNFNEELGTNSLKEKTEKISIANLINDKSEFVETCVTSPKREGSRFQEIFQKEKKNSYLEESKDVENIIKAVLSENVSKIDAERLNNTSKPLPNGVLTVEEIEKGMTSSPIEFKRVPSKSTTIDTLTSFEPSQNSFLSSSVLSPSVDNSKVVNWLSNLNMNVKESENEPKPVFPDSQNFATVNNMMHPPPSMFLPVGGSKFAPALQHPPGLPLMLNANQLQQQQQQQTLQQQLLQQQQQHSLQQQQHCLQQQLQMPQHLTLQQQQSMQQSLQNQKHFNLMKQLSLGQSNNVNMSQRNPLMNIQHEACVPEKYKLNTQQNSSNDVNVGQSIFNNLILKNNLQMNHINERNNMVMMNGPPGLTNMNMSRPIVKTNPQFLDFAQLNDPNNQQFLNNFGRPVNSNPIYAANPEMLNNNRPAQFNQLDMYKNMRNRDVTMTQAMLTNNYPANQQHQQQPMTAFDHSQQHRSSSNKMLANLFNVNSSYLPPLPQQAKYADQIETENI